ncbi:hypothetical protein ID866_8480, partial [Astraeus odoratus]
ELASILDVPHVSLDALFWKPNWTKSTLEEFRAKVHQRLTENEKGWVVDGSYDYQLGGLVTERRTDVIWLDPPFLLYFPRLIIRTILRMVGYVDGCAPGCFETPRDVFFSKKDSILYRAIRYHYIVHRREGENLKRWGIQVGGNMRRIGGWGTELELWKLAIVRMMENR